MTLAISPTVNNNNNNPPIPLRQEATFNEEAVEFIAPFLYYIAGGK